MTRQEQSPLQGILNTLMELTSGWNAHDEHSPEERRRARALGQELHALGGIATMRAAYTHIHTANRFAAVLQHYWHGIGDWRA